MQKLRASQANSEGIYRRLFLLPKFLNGKMIVCFLGAVKHTNLVVS